MSKPWWSDLGDTSNYDARVIDPSLVDEMRAALMTGTDDSVRDLALRRAARCAEELWVLGDAFGEDVCIVALEWAGFKHVIRSIGKEKFCALRLEGLRDLLERFGPPAIHKEKPHA